MVCSAVYMCIAMVSKGSGQAYIHAETESIAWGEAYEILENPPSVRELCVKVSPVKLKVGEVILFSATEMVAVASYKPHDCDR